MEDKDTKRKKKNIIIINDKGEMLSVTKKTLDGKKEDDDTTGPEEVSEVNREEDAEKDMKKDTEGTEKKNAEGVERKDAEGVEKDAERKMETAEKTREDEGSNKKCCEKCSETKECSDKPEDGKEAAAGDGSKNDPKEEFTPLDSKETEEKAENTKSFSKENANVFMPPILDTEAENANKEIFEEREKGNILAEGWMWKKRRIFSCFWHQKYFVLTKDGILKYYKANGKRHAKGNWDMKKSIEVRNYNLSSEENNHPCRIMVFFPDCSFLLAFDERKTKDYWVDKLNRAIEMPRK
ncbi:PH domain-containing protein [Encephalitozoon hellem]|nr:PH domain-containing protein [Encephalitozoon hellem]